MTTTYTYSEARQKLASVLEKAEREGEVRIIRKNGLVFIIKPEKQCSSPLDVPGIDIRISLEEIVDIVREGRSRSSY
jgi:antitoxin Phd